jgi:hypothetical protein
MTSLQVVGFQIDFTQCVQAVLGAGIKIFNFLARNDLQPNAFIYAGDISPSAGDSEGWRITLQSIAQRSGQGKTYAEVGIGFPGQNVMADILQSPFGPRWLGILAMVSLIPEEIKGSDELHTFCKTVAHSEAREYILNKEQTDRIWIMSRELFLDTVVHRQYLTIISKCVNQCRQYQMSAMYTGSKKFFTPTMTAALRLWELQSRDTKGRKLWASGSAGFAHLTLYLSAVCGFHVTVRLENGDLCFGDELRKVEVVIQAGQHDQDEWETGFLMDDMSIEDTARHFLSPGDIVQWKPHDPQTVGCAPLQSSVYVLKEGNLDAPGMILTLDLRIWMERLKEWDIAHSISSWLSNYLHRLMVMGLASMEGYKIMPRFFLHNRARRQALTERLIIAMSLLDPGLVVTEDRKELVGNLSEGKDSRMVTHPKASISKEKVEQLCTCRPEGQTQPSEHSPHCVIEEMYDMLRDVALKLWVLSHMDYSSQRLLRDAGPNGGWNISNILPIIPRSRHGLLPTDIPPLVPIKEVLRALALRLTGRPIAVLNRKVLAMAAGGAVIGLHGNEALEISCDTGHCLYITPGSIATKERRIKEMFQSSILPEPGKAENCADLKNIEKPFDGFGEAGYSHVVQLHGDSAAVSAVINCGTKVLHIDILKAIDYAGDIRQWQGCLEDCARGRLTADDLDKVRVVDKTNYGDLSAQRMDSTAHKKVRLTVIFADRNSLVQRAVVSHMSDNPSIVQLGRCVHCAVRDALMRHIRVLLD